MTNDEQPVFDKDKAQKYFDKYTPLSPEQIVEVLHATGFEYCERLWWRDDYNGRLLMYVSCNDLFAWGSADCEVITPENYQSLIDTLREVQGLLGEWDANDAFELWCCRQRGMRPQKPYYKHLDVSLHELFNACGPERDE